jgi:hypothetical protein
MRRYPLLLPSLLAVLAGCSSGGARAPARPPPESGVVGDRREVAVRELTPQDLAEFERSWALFVAHDPRWPAARDRWLEKGGAAPYVLSENLFRYFWSASKFRRMDEVVRVGESAAKVGEPAVAYFAKALVTDRWPLQEPVTTSVFNADDPGKPLRRTFTHFEVDDMTRQHSARVLASIGPPAVPTLASPAVLASASRSSRVYGAYALGTIATDEAVRALAGVLAASADWQTRGAAAKALGFALGTNPAAREPLEAARADPDEFVRRKVEEALRGRVRLEF